MKVPSLIAALFFCCVLRAGAQYPPLQPSARTTPRPPEVEHHLPIDQPAQVSAHPPRRTVEAAQVRRDAEELARLAQSIQSKVELLGKGVLPKDLNDQLKRIEKLSKQLRRETSL